MIELFSFMIDNNIIKGKKQCNDLRTADWEPPKKHQVDSNNYVYQELGALKTSHSQIHYATRPSSKRGRPILRGRGGLPGTAELEMQANIHPKSILLEQVAVMGKEEKEGQSYPAWKRSLWVHFKNRQVIFSRKCTWWVTREQVRTKTEESSKYVNQVGWRE